VLLAQTSKPPAEAPQYFDEPNFIAAGVTDTTNRGGHGSDPVLRSAEALVQAAASLGSPSAPAATEQSLRDAIAHDPNNAELHHSLANVEEKAANFLEALREYGRAAELEPSEAHIFDLGVELLTHRATEQASAVFSRGARLFPNSSRMLVAYAVADYSRGLYDQARARFFDAIDRNPADPAPYLFLGKVQSSAITQSDGFAERMERFQKLHPDNAWANYYYAVSLRRQSRGIENAGSQAKAQALLERAVELDSQLAGAWLELGILHADRNEYRQAIAAWEHAAAAAPRMEEAHYRLAQAYRKTGEPEKAKAQIELYEKLAKQSAEEFERERTAVKQFVFAAPGPAR
jgi:tetratricopeptide (TPR) repeat protein